MHNRQDDPRAETAKAVAKRGAFVLLSSDMAHNNHLKANWGDGFSAVIVTFVSKMKHAGVKPATIHKILTDNPRRFLAFVPKRQSVQKEEP